MSLSAEQASRRLANWWNGRIYFGAKGVGLAELSEYVEWLPDFVVPSEEVFSRAGYSNLVRGKGGLEVYPESVEVEHIVSASPAGNSILVPARDIKTEYGKFYVRVPGGSQREVILVSGSKNSDKGAQAEVRAGLSPGDRILVKRRHPQAGTLKREPVARLTEALWDKFFYFCRLVDRVKMDIWGNIAGKEERKQALEDGAAAIFLKCTRIKKLPSIE